MLVEIKRGTEVNRPTRGFAFIMLKPLACERGINSLIKDRISELGRVTACERVKVSRDLIEAHYLGIKYDKDGNINRHYYPITSYLTGKTVEAMVVEDVNGVYPHCFIDMMRKFVGPSNPVFSKEWQLRHTAVEKSLPFKRVLTLPEDVRDISNSYCLDNLIHCSDSIESARREVELWFSGTWVSEKYAKVYEAIRK